VDGAPDRWPHARHGNPRLDHSPQPAPPDRADVLFLRLMVAHHEAAVPMAQAILKRTDEPEVRQLAKAIENSQKAEIENMKAMLDQKVGDSAQAELEPANGSQTTGTATLSTVDGGGMKVVQKVFGLPNSETMYLAHIHPGTCAEEEAGGGEARPFPPRARCYREDRVPTLAGRAGCEREWNQHDRGARRHAREQALERSQARQRPQTWLRGATAGELCQP
jgi:hypothetical protein